MRAASEGSSKDAPATRREQIEGGTRGQQRSSLRKALDRYLGVLARNGGEPAIHLKVAELLVKLQRPDEAADQFAAAAACYARQGFDERELGVYRSAVARLPHHLAFWERIAAWQRTRGLRADALQTLQDARLRFERRSHRPQAIALLRAVIDLDPEHLAAITDLADLLVRTGQRAEARRLYQRLAARTTGPWLRQARRALFLLGPTPAAAWRWARALAFGR